MDEAIGAREPVRILCDRRNMDEIDERTGPPPMPHPLARTITRIVRASESEPVHGTRAEAGLNSMDDLPPWPSFRPIRRRNSRLSATAQAPVPPSLHPPIQHPSPHRLVPSPRGSIVAWFPVPVRTRSRRVDVSSPVDGISASAASRTARTNVPRFRSRGPVVERPHHGRRPIVRSPIDGLESHSVHRGEY